MNNVADRVRTVRSDVMKFLTEKASSQGTTDSDDENFSQSADVNDDFDLVIVDPPNLGSDRTNVPKAIRFYERLVHAAVKFCAPRGFLFLASCTHHVGEAELLGAAGRTLQWQGRPARIVSTGGQGADHPGHLALPESRYLRSLLLQLD